MRVFRTRAFSRLDIAREVSDADLRTAVKELRNKNMAKSILQTVHETAHDLARAGAMDVATLREFDGLCLAPVKDYTPSQIKRIRLANRASQGVFAAYFNTSPSTAQKWEQGQKNRMDRLRNYQTWWSAKVWLRWHSPANP
jgi:putative transcriptional regulator